MKQTHGEVKSILPGSYHTAFCFRLRHTRMTLTELVSSSPAPMNFYYTVSKLKTVSSEPTACTVVTGTVTCGWGVNPGLLVWQANPFPTECILSPGVSFLKWGAYSSLLP